MSRLEQAARTLGLLAPAAALLLCTAPAFALTYGECTALVDKSPADGYNAAIDWTKKTDDPAAQHCAALAEVALKRYGAAADRLNRLVEQTENPYESAALLAQLGQVRMLDGKADLAVQAYSRAVKQTPNNAELLSERARAYAAMGDWPHAVKDLDAAVQVEDDNAELQLLYATALREAGDLPEASKAIAKALALAPNEPANFLERGRIRLLAGDRKGAAEDWKRVLSSAAKSSPEYQAANASLKALDKVK
ncbi:tetratricopeptide repeat protein [Zavarzinia sp.]|uniref:tetratricopeptide repeat protein n=1 Tax=Zavarzinia sp. TaxID=2027920 RepID=UPI0035629850